MNPHMKIEFLTHHPIGSGPMTKLKEANIELIKANNDLCGEVQEYAKAMEEARKFSLEALGMAALFSALTNSILERDTELTKKILIMGANYMKNLHDNEPEYVTKYVEKMKQDFILAGQINNDTVH